MAQHRIPALTSPDIYDRLLHLLQLEPTHRVVEIGCGRGEMVDRIIPQLTGGYFLAIDKNWKMLNTVSSNHEEALGNGTLELLDYAVGPGLSTPNRSSDRIICHNAAEWLIAHWRFFDDLERVLRPGGHAVISYTDYRSIHYESSYPELSQLLIEDFSEQRQKGIALSDRRVGQRFSELIDASAFASGEYFEQNDSDQSFAHGSYSSIFAEALAFSAKANSHIDNEQIQRWKEDLLARSLVGEFSFTQTTYIVVATRADEADEEA